MITFFRHLYVTIMELKEPNWCVNIWRSSQPCISMAFCSEFSKVSFFVWVSLIKNKVARISVQCSEQRNITHTLVCVCYISMFWVTTAQKMKKSLIEKILHCLCSEGLNLLNHSKRFCSGKWEYTNQISA